MMQCNHLPNSIKVRPLGSPSEGYRCYMHTLFQMHVGVVNVQLRPGSSVLSQTWIENSVADLKQITSIRPNSTRIR